MAKKQHPLLHIIWEDHASSDPWQSFENVDMTPALVHSVGWKIREDKRLLAIAQSMRHAQEKCFAVTFIVKSCIRHRKEIHSPLIKKMLKSV